MTRKYHNDDVGNLWKRILKINLSIYKIRIYKKIKE